MTEYIKNLRKLVGHIPLIQCGASVIVENNKNEILLQLRTDNHCWGYAGGSMDIGESLEEVAKRELFEETGLFANKLELFEIFSGEDYHYIYPNQDEVYIIDVVYICRDYTGELKSNLKENHELKFFNIDNLPKNLSPPIVNVIKKYILSRKN